MSRASGQSRPCSRLLLGIVAVSMLAIFAAALAILVTQDWFLGLVVAMLIASIVAVCVRPTLATWAFLFLMYINAPAVAVQFHDVPQPVAMATVGLLLIPVAYYVVVRREPFYLDSLVWWLLAFCGVHLVSSLFAANVTTAMDAFLTLLMEGLFIFLLVSNAIRTTSVTWALIAAGFFMGSLGIVQKATGTYWRDYKGFAQVSEPELNAYGEIVSGRWPSGPIGDKNYYAQFMLMLLPFALFRAWNERSRLLRTAGWGSAAVILAGIALSGSRGAAIGLVAMLLVMIGLGYANLRHAVALGLISASVLMVMPQYRERVLSIVRVADVLRGRDMRQADASVQGRMTEMAAAVLVFFENPLWGVGPGNFPAHFVEKADLLGFTVHGVERRAHCLYLEIAAETGIFGLLTLSAILGITIRNLHRAHTVAPTTRLQGETAAALCALVAMMVTGLFLSLAFVRYFWLIIGVCTAIARVVSLQISQDYRCVTVDSCGQDASRAGHTENAGGTAPPVHLNVTSC